MAHLVPKIICAALAAVASLSAAPFSHRVHLKLKLECVSCHAAATGSTRVEDNLLPEKTVCLRCHKEAKTGAPRTTLVSKFSHQQHLKMGNIAPLLASAILKKTYLSPPDGIGAHLNSENACEACHRGLEESDAPAKAAYPQMADCLVCHTKIEPPFSCRTCHAESAQLRPASHTPDLIDTHSSGKLQFEKQSCAVCHGRKFLCLGCHQ